MVWPMLGLNMTWCSLAIKSVYWWRDDASGSCFRPVVALSLVTSVILWPTILEEDLHPIWSDKAHTCSSASASIAKMNACRRNRMQLHPDSDVGHGIPWCGPCLAST